MTDESTQVDVGGHCRSTLGKVKKRVYEKGPDEVCTCHFRISAKVVTVLVTLRPFSSPAGGPLLLYTCPLQRMARPPSAPGVTITDN